MNLCGQIVYVINGHPPDSQSKWVNYKRSHRLDNINGQMSILFIGLSMTIPPPRLLFHLQHI